MENERKKILQLLQRWNLIIAGVPKNDETKVFEVCISELATTIGATKEELDEYKIKL